MAPWLGTRIAGPFLADPFIPAPLIRPARRLADRLSRGLAALIAVSLASWLGSVGLLAWHFESISPIGIAANLVMVPLASLVMGLAAASLAAYGLHLTWITLLAQRLNVAAAYGLAALAQGFSSIPGATIHTGRGPRPLWMRRSYASTWSGIGVRGPFSSRSPRKDGSGPLDDRHRRRPHLSGAGFSVDAPPAP